MFHTATGSKAKVVRTRSRSIMVHTTALIKMSRLGVERSGDAGTVLVMFQIRRLLGVLTIAD